MRFQRIQDLRTDADLSQKQISEILHISQRSYSHYETGSRNIPIEMIIWLAVPITKSCITKKHALYASRKLIQLLGTHNACFVLVLWNNYSTPFQQ